MLLLLIRQYQGAFTPIELSKTLGVTSKTVINRLAVLVKTGFVVPHLVSERIRSYELSGFAKENAAKIKKQIG